MQLTTFVATLFAALAVANPVAIEERTGGGSYDACSGLYDTLQCCATDVGGVAALDCSTPSKVPTSANNFEDICADIGKTAKCCVIPILGQDVLCQTPLGLGR